MSAIVRAQVLVVGAGPVGLTLAMDLAWRGVHVVVAEVRQCGEPPEVKCNHVAARSMEIFRRLGVAGKIRDSGLPADYPNDVAYRTTFTGHELTRIPIPCRRDRFTATGGPVTGWPTPEPPHRSTRFSWSRSLPSMQPACPACVFSTAPGSKTSSSPRASSRRFSKHTGLSDGAITLDGIITRQWSEIVCSFGDEWKYARRAS